MSYCCLNIQTNIFEFLLTLTDVDSWVSCLIIFTIFQWWPVRSSTKINIGTCVLIVSKPLIFIVGDREILSRLDWNYYLPLDMSDCFVHKNIIHAESWIAMACQTRVSVYYMATELEFCISNIKILIFYLFDGCVCLLQLRSWGKPK